MVLGIAFHRTELAEHLMAPRRRGKITFLQGDLQPVRLSHFLRETFGA